MVLQLLNGFDVTVSIKKMEHHLKKGEKSHKKYFPMEIAVVSFYVRMEGTVV